MRPGGGVVSCHMHIMVPLMATGVLWYSGDARAGGERRPTHRLDEPRAQPASRPTPPMHAHPVPSHHPWPCPLPCMLPPWAPPSHTLLLPSPVSISHLDVCTPHSYISSSSTAPRSRPNVCNSLGRSSRCSSARTAELGADDCRRTRFLRPCFLPTDSTPSSELAMIFAKGTNIL